MTESLLALFQYTGKLADEAGLYHNVRARFYSPTIDRFITEDTMTGSLDDPLSLNRYEYARDNPETLIDPTGHMFQYSNSGAGGIDAPLTNLNINGGAPFLDDGDNPFLVQTTTSSPSYTIAESGEQYGPPIPGTMSSSSERCVGNSAPPYSVCGYSGQSGAIAVTAGFFIAGVGLAIATPFAVVVAGPSGLLVGAAAIGAFYGGGDSAVYDYEAGANATPQGSFEAGATGVVGFVQQTMDFLGF